MKGYSGDETLPCSAPRSCVDVGRRRGLRRSAANPPRHGLKLPSACIENDFKAAAASQGFTFWGFLLLSTYNAIKGHLCVYLGVSLTKPSVQWAEASVRTDLCRLQAFVTPLRSKQQQQTSKPTALCSLWVTGTTLALRLVQQRHLLGKTGDWPANTEAPSPCGEAGLLNNCEIMWYRKPLQRKKGFF